MRCTVLAAGILALGQFAFGNSIVKTLGDVSFTNNTNQNQAAWTAADGSGDAADVAPFNGIFCGSDTLANGAGNCNTSWTFSGISLGGENIIGATIDLGIGDLDSAAAGNQVFLFTVGGIDLTVDLNGLAEAGGGSANSIYRQYLVTIPSTAFATLASAVAGGTAVTQFTAVNPGLGALGATNSNGVFLDYSTLTITTQPVAAPTPEPATAVLLGCSMLGLSALAYRRRRS
jgi:hypothetical protein